MPVAELLLMSGDQEQRVVDADAEPDHRRQRRAAGRDGDDVAEQPDHRQRDASPTTAVMIGIPIATRLPSTKLRMIIAAMMPTISLLSVVGSSTASSRSSPPAATLMPAFVRRVRRRR